MANNTRINGGPHTDVSRGELVKRLSEQTSRLAHQEVELAKAELLLQGKRVETGLGMFGGAGAIGFYALGALVAAAVLGLATAVPAWLSALIIALVLGAIAGLLALQGKSQMREATTHPVAEEITASVKEDVQWAKSRAQAGRQ
jgi:Putative Actinobacterial Holin-X, holin superfamily III